MADREKRHNNKIEQYCEAKCDIDQRYQIIDGGQLNIGTLNNNYGITLKDYEAGLKRREKEIRAMLDSAHVDKLSILQIELAQVENNLFDINESHEKHIAFLQWRIDALKDLSKIYTADTLIKAKEALLKGNTSEADQLFVQFENGAESVIEQVAEAAFQRGAIAEENIDYQKAYDKYIRAAQLNSENPTYQMAIGNIAYTMGQYDEAIEYYQKSLDLYLIVSGKQHPDVAMSWNNLGKAWRLKGDFDKAIEYYEKSLKVRRTFFGSKHSDVAYSWNNLGNVWKDKGKVDKAIECHEKSLKLKKAIFGSQHPDVAVSLNNLGIAWAKKGNIDRAIIYYKKALNVWRARYKDQHPKVAIAWNNLGNAWMEKGNVDKAIVYYKKALNARLAVFSDQHPDVGSIWKDLGEAWNSKGDFDQATECFEKAENIAPALPRNRHQKIANSETVRTNKYYEEVFINWLEASKYIGSLNLENNNSNNSSNVSVDKGQVDHAMLTKPRR